MTTLGCFIQSGNYPHLGHGELFIRYPPSAIPTRVNGLTKEWTDSEILATSAPEPDQYYFLPALIAHEFGHALGVWHLPGGHLVGYYLQGNAWNNTPTQNDLDGFLETLQEHGH